MCESEYLIVICLMKIIKILPRDTFDEGIFCTCVRICSLHISKKKYFRLKCFFIKLSVSACFPTFIETYPRKKGSVFGSMIAV